MKLPPLTHNVEIFTLYSWVVFLAAFVAVTFQTRRRTLVSADNNVFCFPPETNVKLKISEFQATEKNTRTGKEHLFNFINFMVRGFLFSRFGERYGSFDNYGPNKERNKQASKNSDKQTNEQTRENKANPTTSSSAESTYRSR